MEESAVEWFADRIKHGGLVTKKQFNELLKQAKEMEDEQKHSEYMRGWYEGVDLTE